MFKFYCMLAHTIFVSLEFLLKKNVFIGSTHKEHRCIIYYLSCHIRLFIVVSKCLILIISEVLSEFLNSVFHSPWPRKTILKEQPSHLSVCYSLQQGIVAMLEIQGCPILSFILEECSRVFKCTKERSHCLCSRAFPILRTFHLYLRSTVFAACQGFEGFCYHAWPEVCYYCEDLQR